jgi:hypothetical protein
VAGITIQDDERPAVSVVVSDAGAGEAGPDPGAFTVSRTGPADVMLTVHYDLAGAATQGVDYEALSGSLTIPVGASTASVTITPIDDALVEGAEGVLISLRPDPAYVVVTPGVAGLNIADDDLAAVTIEATDPEAAEAGLDPALFTLGRTGDTSVPLTVRLAASGSAAAADHQAIGQLVTFPAGQASTSVALVPRADNLVEGSEERTLTILPDLDYVVGSPSSATAVILDDAPIVTLVASDPDADEAGLDPGAFALSRSGGDTAAALSVLVSIGGTAIANGDYVVLSGVVSFPAGQTATQVPVTVLADNRVEGDESVVMTLLPGPGTSYVVGSPSTASVTIADDPPVVTAAATDPDAAEAGLDPGTVTFTRSGGHLSGALNVFFTKSGSAANGDDYASLGGAVSLVTIPAGQASTSATVLPRADNLVEGPEVATHSLETSSGYVIGVTGSASVTIADDPPVVDLRASDPDAAEAGPDPGAFTFSRQGGNLAVGLTVAFTRGGTATNVSDFVTIPSSVTIPAGQASAVLAIVPLDDTTVEGPETVTLTLAASGSVVVGPSDAATVTIADND